MTTEEGVHLVEDWAEVHRLHEREGISKAAIARRLGMSCNTVDRLLGLAEPPRCGRVPGGSQLDPFADVIAAQTRQAWGDGWEVAAEGPESERGDQFTDAEYLAEATELTR